MGTQAPEGGFRHHGTIDPRLQTAESSTCWEGCGLGTLWGREFGSDPGKGSTPWLHNF